MIEQAKIEGMTQE